MNTQHFQSLQRMYAAAPINAIYRPAIEISAGRVVIEIELSSPPVGSTIAANGQNNGENLHRNIDNS